MYMSKTLKEKGSRMNTVHIVFDGISAGGERGSGSDRHSIYSPMRFSDWRGLPLADYNMCLHGWLGERPGDYSNC
jgi:hypothetical protein